MTDQVKHLLGGYATGTLTPQEHATLMRAALEDQDYLRATRSRIIATRERLERELPRFGFVVTPSRTNFVWCRQPQRPTKPIYEERGRVTRTRS